MSRGFDSYFGPPSQPINIAEFLQQANSALLSGSFTNTSWEQLTPEHRNAVEAEITESVAFQTSSQLLNKYGTTLYCLRTYCASTNLQQRLCAAKQMHRHRKEESANAKSLQKVASLPQKCCSSKRSLTLSTSDVGH